MISDNTENNVLEFIEDSENHPYCVDYPYCVERDCLACIKRNGKDSSRPHLFARLRKRKWKKSQ